MAIGRELTSIRLAYVTWLQAGQARNGTALS